MTLSPVRFIAQLCRIVPFSHFIQIKKFASYTTTLPTIPRIVGRTAGAGQDIAHVGSRDLAKLRMEIFWKLWRVFWRRICVVTFVTRTVCVLHTHGLIVQMTIINMPAYFSPSVMNGTKDVKAALQERQNVFSP